MRKMLLIMNPHTGSGRLRRNFLNIVKKFTDAGYDMTICPTQRPNDATRIVEEEARRYDIVVSCGGDGTLNETVEGLMKLEDPPLLGYIPGGTTNDFASSLHLPRNNMRKATERIIEPHHLFRYDVGLFNGDNAAKDQAINYVAAFGAFTDVSYSTPQRTKNLMGHLAYILQAISKLPSIKSYRMRIENGDTVVEDNFILGLVSNSVSIGGFSIFDRSSVKMDDGYFEVLLLRPPTSLEEYAMLPRMLRTKDLNSPLLEAMRVNKLTVISEEPLPWTLDGEYGGTHQEVSIDVVKRALTICI